MLLLLKPLTVLPFARTSTLIAHPPKQLLEDVVALAAQDHVRHGEMMNLECAMVLHLSYLLNHSTVCYFPKKLDLTGSQFPYPPFLL